MGSTQTAYEALLMENHGGQLAKKLRTKETFCSRKTCKHRR
jgi:hypothetical protein